MSSSLVKILWLLSLGLAEGFLSHTLAPNTSVRPYLVSDSTTLWAKKKNPKGDTFDMKELRQRINEVTNPYSQLFAADWNLAERPENVHVILFKPDTEDQGVHTIEYPKGSGNNFVLAFESKDACDKFAASLKAQNFHDLTPKLYELDSLESFCDMLGVFVQVVPEGMEILPPTQNVQNLGKHNPHLKEDKNHLDYIFDMFELEVDELGLVTEAGSWE